MAFVHLVSFVVYGTAADYEKDDDHETPRVICNISPGRHNRMRGPQVPVPRQTSTVIPFTSYRPASSGYFC